MKPIPDMGLFFRTEVGNLVADNEYWATLVGGETAPNPSLVAVTPSASVPVPDYSAYGEEHDRSLALYQLPYPYLPPVAWGRQLGEPMAVYQTRVLIELAMLDLLSVDPASRRLQAVAVVDADTITSQGEQAAAWLGGGDWDTGDRLAKAFDARFAATFANGDGDQSKVGLADLVPLSREIASRGEDASLAMMVRNIAVHAKAGEDVSGDVAVLSYWIPELPGMKPDDMLEDWRGHADETREYIGFLQDLGLQAEGSVETLDAADLD